MREGRIRAERLAGRTSFGSRSAFPRCCAWRAIAACAAGHLADFLDAYLALLDARLNLSRVRTDGGGI